MTAPATPATAATESPAVKSQPVVMPPDATVGDAFRASLEACLAHLDANEPLFLEGRHRDNLHQTRVSWRRARAAMSLFRPLFEHDEESMELKVRMREIVLPLGPARDADVLLKQAEDEGWPYRTRRTLRGRRRRTYAVAVPLLRSPQWLEVKADLRAWLADPQWLDFASGPRDAPARDLTDAALQKRYARVAAAGPDLLTLQPHELHTVRIEGKKLRYGCEFFADLYADAPGSLPNEFSTALGLMQDAFGEANDHATALHMLRAHGLPTDVLGPVHGRAECVTTWAGVMALEPFWR
ncbi:MAG: CHAD domain-containing protein [Actinobacteria bacterium]|nr:CHAD domain-containing protein [Actinomycetota bacterium]